MLIVDAHLDLAMNAIEWNRDLSRPIDEIRAREHGHTDRPDRGKGTVSFAEMRRGGVGLCVATQIARYSTPESPVSGMAFARAGLGDDPGAARLVPFDGGARRAGAGTRCRRARSAPRPVGERRLGRAHRLRPQPRRRRLARDHRAPRTRVRARPASGGARALRSRRVRAGHERRGRPRRARARARSRDGSSRHDPRRHASLRRELSRRARPFPRSGLGEPLELPIARPSQPAVQRRSDPRARSSVARSSAPRSTRG